MMTNHLERLWPHRHRLSMAALLASGTPLVFFTGAVGVMAAPTVSDVASLALWWLLHALLLAGLMLASDQVGQALGARPGRWIGIMMALAGATVTAAVATLATSGRARILIEQGVVTDVATMHMMAFPVSLALALLFLVYRGRSRAHATAVSRRLAAQATRQGIEHRVLQARLQALQARIDPLLLFEMLEAVRCLYEHDPARAENLLDELTAFLRAALPRLNAASSSVPGEAELARACARLRALAQGRDFGLAVSIAPDAAHARCPPGLLLPLLNDGLRAVSGPCSLTVTRTGNRCLLVLALPVWPSADCVDRARRLLAEVYGTEAALQSGPPVAGRSGPPADGPGLTGIHLTIPYALAA